MNLEDNRDESEELTAYSIRRGEEMLARLEAQLEGGVYETGPQKGQGFHPSIRRHKERHAEELRADLGRLRGVQASIPNEVAEVLGLEMPAAVRSGQGEAG